MPIQAKRVYDPPEPEDGFRLLTMRRWPRGIAKGKVSGWDKRLAPSTELLADVRTGVISWEEYVNRYRWEMVNRPDAIEGVADLRKQVNGETVTIMCGCKDETHCHRTLLKELIEAGP
ncbi:MAG: DUF488 family protein [Chloroflexi bacterium]|nr:DUF488 family protein [Chloroflexota bacterium]